MKKTFVTYFEPFGGRDVNASKEIALSLRGDFELVSLPVSWKRTLPILNEIIDSEPRYIFMLGEAKNYQDVTIELVGRNICSGTDEDGEKKDDDRILRATPKKFRTTFDVDGHGFTTSDNAGKFLCNYVYYISLLKAEITKVIFIHVPYLHSKGNCTKENVLNTVQTIIDTLIDYDDSFLLRIGGKPVSVNVNNAYNLFPTIQKEYDFPDIIIGITRNEDGSYIMTGRADGYKGVWYEYGDGKEEESLSRRLLYYRILYFQSDLEEDERVNSVFNELTKRFDIEEYDGSEKILKRYLNLFISRAEYVDEMEFYISLDRIYDNLMKSVLEEEETKAIRFAKELVSRLGLKKTTEILFKEVKK